MLIQIYFYTKNKNKIGKKVEKTNDLNLKTDKER